MSHITVNHDAAGRPVDLFYQDWGSGRPIVLIHGWPLSHAMWEHQLTALPHHGVRVIAYDRRGFGQSSKPWDGYEYDTLADDLKGLLDGLDLQDVTLVGFSMGGGEVARYMRRHQGARVGRVALVSAVTPGLLKSESNPKGLEDHAIDDMIDGVMQDRAAFLAGFGKQFYGVGLLTKPVSQPALDWTQGLAMAASPKATIDCINAFGRTDFQADLDWIKTPTLIVHGENDAIVPIAISAERAAQLIPQASFKRYTDAPHGLHLTHAQDLSSDLLLFTNGA